MIIQPASLSRLLAGIGSITPGNRPSGSSQISQPGAPEPLGKPGCIPQGIWKGLALLLVLVTPWQEKCVVPHVQTFPEAMRQSYGRCQRNRDVCLCPRSIQSCKCWSKGCFEWCGGLETDTEGSAGHPQRATHVGWEWLCEDPALCRAAPAAPALPVLPSSKSPLLREHPPQPQAFLDVPSLINIRVSLPKTISACLSLPVAALG